MFLLSSICALYFSTCIFTQYPIKTRFINLKPLVFCLQDEVGPLGVSVTTLGLFYISLVGRANRFVSIPIILACKFTTLSLKIKHLNDASYGIV